MAEETQQRKADHIRICLDEKSQAKKATTGFEDIHFIHKALPEINKQKNQPVHLLFWTRR